MTSLIPQVLITLSPEGGLQLELPASGSRVVTRVTVAEAGKKILRILGQQKARIDREAQAERAPRRHKQPDWRLIAKHPQAEIREVRVQLIPARSRGIAQSKSKRSLDEMGI